MIKMTQETTTTMNYCVKLVLMSLLKLGTIPKELYAQTYILLWLELIVTNYIEVGIQIHRRCPNCFQKVSHEILIQYEIQ